MKGKSLLKLVGAICLAALIAIPLAVSCAAPAPEPVPGPPGPAGPAGAPGAPAPAPAPAPEAEVFKWVWQGYHPSGTVYHKFSEAVFDRIRIASAGRLDVKCYGGGEIVPESEALLACRDGVIDMTIDGSVMLGHIGKAIYILDPSGLPGGPHPFDLMAWYYVGDGEKLMNEILEPYNCIWIGCRPSPAEVFCHSNVKLESGEDFKGVKFRTFGMWGEVLKEYGASVVTLSGDEIYEAAQRGLIDAFEYCPPSTNWPMGFHEITKYVGAPGIHSPSCAANMIANLDSWNELPSDLQQILKDEWASYLASGFLAEWYLDAVAMSNYEEYGTELVVLSDEFQKEICMAGKRICDEFADEDPLFKRIYENQKAFFKTFRGASEVMQSKYCLFDY